MQLLKQLCVIMLSSKHVKLIYLNCLLLILLVFLFRKRMRRFLQIINTQIKNLFLSFENKIHQIHREAISVNLTKR